MITDEAGIVGVVVNLVLLWSCISLACAAVVWLVVVVGLFKNAAAIAVSIGRLGRRFSASDDQFLRQMHIRLH